MSDHPFATNAFEAYENDYRKHSQDLDLCFQTPSDIHAPGPDLFEADLESHLAALDPQTLQLLTVNPIDLFTFTRAETPTCGPPSTFTVSSESTYDSQSSHFSYASSPYTSSNGSFPFDIDIDIDSDMNFQKFRVDAAVSDYGASLSSSGLAGAVDPNPFGALPITPPRSPEMGAATPSKAMSYRSSFSEYAPARGPGPFNYRSLELDHTVVPSHTLSAPPPPYTAPALSNHPTADSDGHTMHDPRRKYKCNHCTRAFARAYNLKTHMATHDPNRPKPHVCPHRPCGRAFSRKHDLARHQISLHGAQKGDKDVLPPKKSIGVDRGARTWCDMCGKGLVGRSSVCGCGSHV